MTSRGPGAPTDTPSRWVGPRGWRILHTGAWSMVAKVAAAANLFLTVPFVLHALGPAQFGAWATLVSVMLFAGFLDFGFGNGTMNLVAAAQGRGATFEVGNIVREGRRTLFRIALWLAVAVLVIVPLIPWHRLLGLPETMAGSSRAAATAVLFAIVLAVPLNLANRVQLGLGRGDRAFRWQAIGQLLTVVTVIGLAKSGASLTLLTTAAVATPLLASAANTWLLWQDPAMATSPEAGCHQEIVAHIRREGTLFFVLQLAAALAFSADLPLISALRSPTEAGTYAIVQRLFSIVPLSLSLAWAPLWPIYRQALAAGDHDWVFRTLRRSVLLAVLFACVTAAVLALGFDHIIGLWMHTPLTVSATMLGGFVAWSILDAAGSGLGTFLNAASILRYQVILAVAFGASCVAAKIIALKAMGIDVLPWVTALTYLTITLLPIWLLRHRIKQIVLSKNY